MALMPSVFGGRSNIFDPFSLETWDPFEGILSGAVPSPLWCCGSGGGGGGSRRSKVAAVANTRIDWRETPEAHVFNADLPGLKEEEVKVEVEEEKALQISGERKREEDEEEDKYHHLERSYRRFVRRFRLPENAKMDQIRASMENGVLCVCIPKEKKQQPEVKADEIGGSC